MDTSQASNSSASQHEWHRQSSPPDNEVPVATPVTTMLGRTDEVAVALIGANAYTTGFSFTLAVRMHRELRDPGLWEMIDHGNSEDAELDKLLLFGVEYSDGRTATTLPRRPKAQAEPKFQGNVELILWPSSGSGGHRSYDQTFWLSPLPSPGQLRVVCAWPALGIAETHSLLDGTAIATAGAHAYVLWPSEPEDDQPVEPTGAPIPPTGWFADHIDRRHS